MGRKSIKEDKSIYFKAREEAGLTRAQASELIGSITESIYGISDSLIKDVNKKIPDEFVYILNKVR